MQVQTIENGGTVSKQDQEFQTPNRSDLPYVPTRICSWNHENPRWHYGSGLPDLQDAETHGWGINTGHRY